MGPSLFSLILLMKKLPYIGVFFKIEIGQIVTVREAFEHDVGQTLESGLKFVVDDFRDSMLTLEMLNDCDEKSGTSIVVHENYFDYLHFGDEAFVESSSHIMPSIQEVEEEEVGEDGVNVTCSASDQHNVHLRSYFGL